MQYLVDLLNLAIQIYILLIFIYVMMSYFPESTKTRLYYYLARICDPLLNMFSWATISGLSFAPMAASVFLIILLEILNYLY